VFLLLLLKEGKTYLPNSWGRPV